MAAYFNGVKLAPEVSVPTTRSLIFEYGDFPIENKFYEVSGSKLAYVYGGDLTHGWRAENCGQWRVLASVALRSIIALLQNGVFRNQDPDPILPSKHPRAALPANRTQFSPNHSVLANLSSFRFSEHTLNRSISKT
jgi:hypothetical protein